MSASKTAEAARKAVEKSQKKETEVRTIDQVISDIRKNFAAGLAVTPADQKLLLSAYDAAVQKAVDLGVQLAQAQKDYQDTSVLVQNLEDGKVRYITEIGDLTHRLHLADQATNAMKLDVQALAKDLGVQALAEDMGIDLHRMDDDGAPAVS